MDPAFPLLDLPADLLLNVLIRVQWSARRVSRAFNAAICAGRESLCIPHNSNSISFSLEDVERLRALLSRLPQLTKLEALSKAQFSDVTVFAACASVRHLCLDTTSMHLSNLDALAPLTRLESLRLGPLHELTSGHRPVTWSQHLTSLTLLACLVLTEVGALARCTALKHLQLDNCKRVTNISALAACTSLVQLDLFACVSLQDISPLSACVLLEDLDLGHCSISCIRPLVACCRLQHLYLHSCYENIDLSVLASFSALQTLDLGFSNICNFSPVADCKHLTSLTISECHRDVSDFSFIASCQRLTTVRWEHHCVDFDILSRLGQLKQLHVNGSGLVNLGALARLTSLVTLDMYTCDGLSQLDMTPFGSLSSLEKLDLSSCWVDDVHCLASCQHLKQLDLSYNKMLEDVGPLAQCGELCVLRLTGCCGVSDVTSLALCTRLRELHLNGTCAGSDDLSPLLPLQSLTRLTLSRVTDATVLRGTCLERAAVWV